MSSSGDISPRRGAVRTKSFRESTHLIPTPGVDAPRPKRVEPLDLRWWIVYPAALSMIVLAVALEVALSESQKKHGFKVPQKNVFKFASTNFLTSFFPILLVAPLGWLWSSIYWEVRRYHPYVILSKGNAKPEDSILLDYISMNKIFAIFFSLTKGHNLVMLAGLTALPTLLLQPLAGSIFSVNQANETIPYNADSTRTLALDPNFGNLNSALAAAGFADAAVANNLVDPPFIHGIWAAADFKAPPGGQYLNGTLVMNTTGIRSIVNCSLPASQQLNTQSITTPSVYPFTATSTSGCQANISVNPFASAQQYNVTMVPNCGPNPTGNVTFQPVFFWFYHTRADGTPQAQGLFCQPFIEVFNITSFVDLNSGNLTNVIGRAKLDSHNANTNVTGAPLNGAALNGVIFPPTPDDVFTAARATAISAAVSGAIFRGAVLAGGPSGVQLMFDQPDGFLNVTNKVYTQHLSVFAKSTYYLPTDDILPADLTFLQPRLFIEPLAAHGLAVILLIVGFSGFVVIELFRRARQNIYLHSFPGSISHALSLTSRSGFGELLVPYDTEYTMQRKLQGLHFRLDDRTGAIVAQDDEGEDVTMDTMGAEDTKMSLMRNTSGGLATPGYLGEPLMNPQTP
ncbi:hypothetical protein BD410DRAFT_841344 [Rickenella mellea]|uniref:Uncharacterized protein n=1 Tax=Rickenella mellea TaxID=50990 RepID=A0A4Y7Q0T6_9AGAM|nr:hypothetical protein BD410DRAFT_841344 [Rickenella mellea]